MGGDRSLALEEQDVEIVLGFPRGHIDMVKRDRLDVSNLLKKWRAKFEKTRHIVTPPEISTVMVGRVDGGLWFRRHLCMLVLSTLVSCMCNDYANQMYFHHFDNVARLRDLNWCKLVVDSLVETQVAWKSGAHKVFVGPTEFVAVWCHLFTFISLCYFIFFLYYVHLLIACVCIFFYSLFCFFAIILCGPSHAFGSADPEDGPGFSWVVVEVTRLA